MDTRIKIYPVPTHDFHIFWTFLPDARDALDGVGRFIRGRTASIPDAASGHA